MRSKPVLTKIIPILALLFSGVVSQADPRGVYVGQGDFQSNTSWGDQTDRPVRLELRTLESGLLLYRDCWTLEPLPLCISSQLRKVGNELWHRDRKVGFMTPDSVFTEYREGSTTILSRLEKTPEGFRFESHYEENHLLIRKTARLSKEAEALKFSHIGTGLHLDLNP